jgi:hypothetical protein
MLRVCSRLAVAVLLVCVTRIAAASDFVLVCPRCEDSSAKYLGSGEIFSRWSDGVVQWYYNPANALPPFDDVPIALAAIQAAIDQWEGVCGIDFQYMGLTEQEPQNFDDFMTVIGWAPIEFAGLGGGIVDAPLEEVLRLGYWPMQEGFVAVRPVAYPDLFSDEMLIFEFIKLMTHELGHMLCLGHSDDPDSVLFANPYNSLFGVRRDDIAAVQALYGPPSILRIPEKFSPPPTDTGVTVSDARFSVGTSWDDLVEIPEVNDETPDQTLYFQVECQNLPSGDGTAYLVDPSGYPHLLWDADNEWANVSSGMGLDAVATIKLLPGTWWYYWVIEDTTVVASSIEVNTTVTRNLAPAAFLHLSAVQGRAPLTVTVEVEASDPERDGVTAVWHVPGNEEWTTPVTGPLREIFTFPDPGVYRIFIAISDDAPRYQGAGAGYRKVLPATVRVYPLHSPPRHPSRRLSPS